MLEPMTDRPLDPNTRLAAERNRLALERTLMAWTRTATSLRAVIAPDVPLSAAFQEPVMDWPAGSVKSAA